MVCANVVTVLQAVELSWASVKGEALPSRGQQQTGQNHPERRHSDRQAPWPSDKGPFSKGSELGQWLKGR